MPSFWIKIQNTGGTVLGEGPIISATRWTSRRRLDQKGNWSFEMPLSDPKGADIDDKYEVYAYTMNRGSAICIGAGVVDPQKTMLSDSPGMVSFSGDGLMQLLTNRLVGNLEIYKSSRNVRPVAVKFYDDTDTSYTDLTNAFDENTSTYSTITAMQTADYIYIGFDSPFQGVDIDVGTAVNGQTASVTVEYYSSSFGGITESQADTTDSGGAPLAQDGYIWWSKEDDMGLTTIDGVEAYWIRLSYDAALDNVDIIDIDAWATIKPDYLKYHDVGAGSNTNLTNGFDDDLATFVTINSGTDWQSDDYVYVAFPSIGEGIVWNLGGTVNATAATMSAQYYSATTEWTGVAGWNDGTLAGGTATMGQDGIMSFTRPTDWEAVVHDGVRALWLRLIPSTNLDQIDVVEVDLDTDHPSHTGVVEIMDYAPTGWSIDTTNGHRLTDNGAYLTIKNENVLQALSKLAEATGEHFRVTTSKGLVWLQHDPTDNPTACAFTAQLASGSDRNSCIITEITKTIDPSDRRSRVYPYGAGVGVAQLDLAKCTRVAPTGYTLSTTDNYLKHDATEAAIGQVEIPITWSHIGRPEGMNQDEAAANQLFDAAKEALDQRINAKNYYDATLVSVPNTIEPGMTLPTRARKTQSGRDLVDVNESLIVLEVAESIARGGYRELRVQLSDSDTFPKTPQAELRKMMEATRYR